MPATLRATRWRRVLCGGLLLWAGLAGLLAPAAAQPLETVHLQLRWKHQFQFAGYYAALEKGYYREEGLDVVLHDGAPDRQPVGEVLAGRAQYAVGNSEVLQAYLQGKPLVALAAIFQHSPSVLLTLRKSGIVTPHDLVGRKVMFMNGTSDADLMTMLYNEGIARSQLTILPSSYDIEDLIAGRVAAINAYLTNEPYVLRQRGIEYRLLNPIDSRVDFYSDILFTTASELARHPARVQAMRRATLQGWRCAMEHPEEIIDLLLTRYQVPKTRAHLAFEAEAMRQLILPDLIPIGSMNPERWQHMAETFALTGMVSRNYALEGFMYEDPALRKLPAWVVPVLAAALALVALAVLAVGYFQRMNRRLQQAEGRLRAANEALNEKVQEVTTLHARLQEQVIRDPLTGLFNRRYLDETLERELARAKRDGYALSLAMIDVDHFKFINDTYGHPAGDEVLQALGALLQAQAREGDIVCRYGGEEFVLVLPRMAWRTAQARAEQWRTAFAALKTRHGELALGATFSVGLAGYPEHGATVQALLASADQALYRAKALGRNRVETAPPAGA